MPTIALVTTIQAPIERVFDLSLSIDLHTDSQSRFGEKAVAGRTSGLIGLDEEVTWQATHFGVRQWLSVRVTAFDRPHYFQDSMVKGALAELVHDHYFREENGKTVINDKFYYRAPLGPLGRLADFLFLRRHFEKLLVERNESIKRVAESDDWREFVG